jgi:hypothetical protein
MRYEVELFDAPYVDDMKPAIRSGAFGRRSGSRYVTDGYDGRTPTRSTAWNPDRLPERTLTT